LSDAGAETIAVVAEHFDGKLRPITWELLGAARELQTRLPATVIAVVVGGDAIGLAAELAPAADETLAIETPNAVSYNGEVCGAVLAEALAERPAAFVLVANTTQGLDFAPALAVRLGAACVTAVEGFAFEDNGILFRRAAHGGKVVAVIRAEAPAVLAVQPGAFRRPDPSANGAGAMTVVRRLAAPARTRNLGVKRALAADGELANAEVVVAAGRGVKKREDLALVRETAALFSRAAVAGSRPLCDAGWLPYQRQVGATGATVAPKFYLACGISGAAQHVVGMRGAGFVAAVNRDPHAAIFNVADVCVVDDLAVFLPLFIAACRGAGKS
jgi:electron transfer flavoprotein alpha subunit